MRNPKYSINTRAKPQPQGRAVRSAITPVSGAAHRKLRKSIAAAAHGRRTDTIHTYLWPTEVVAGVVPDTADLLATYNVMAGMDYAPERVGLTPYLVSLILAGFRPFGGNADAEIAHRKFVQTGASDAADESADFATAMATLSPALTLTLDNFTGFSNKQPRKPAGSTEPLEFSPEQILSGLILKARALSTKDAKLALDTTRQEPLPADLERAVAFLHQAATAMFEAVPEPDRQNGWSVFKANEAVIDAFYRAAQTAGAELQRAAPDTSQSAEQRPASPLSYNPAAPALMPCNDGFDLHRAVALIANELSGEGVDEKKLQAAITTPNGNALSWLLNPTTGLDYFANTEQALIRQQFGIPASAEHDKALNQLQHMATTLSKAKDVTGFGWQNFRPVIASRTNSWIANYWSRLQELSRLTAAAGPIELPEAWRSPAADFLFANSLYPLSEIDALNQQLTELLPASQAALSILMGESPQVVSSQHVSTIEALSETLNELEGALRTAAARCDQALQDARNADDEERSALALACAFKAPDWLAALPRLLGARGGIPDIDAEMPAEKDRFNAAMQFWNDTLQRLNELAAEQHPDVVKHFASEEMRIRVAVRRPFEARDAAHEAELLAEAGSRRALSFVIGMARNLSSEGQTVVISALRARGILNRKTASALIRAGLGSVYRHPMSTSRHEPFALRKLPTHEDLAMVANMVLSLIAGRLAGPGSNTARGEALKDWISSRQAFTNLKVAGIQGDLPASLVDLPSLRAITPFIPLSLQRALGAPRITVATVKRALNLAASALRGSAFRLFREVSTVNLSFRPMNQNNYIYCPKDRSWTPPPSLLAGQFRSAAALRALLKPDESPVNLSPVDLLQRIAEKDPAWQLEYRDGIEGLLVQMPHSWMVGIDKPEWGSREKFACVTVGKSGLDLPLKKAELKTCMLLRLAGPSSRKGELDRLLIGQRKPSDYGIDVALALQHDTRTQMIDCRLHIESASIALQGGPRIVVSTPLQTPAVEQAEFRWADRFVAIDQGEAGIGFAVFEARTGDLIESGAIAIKSIRNLMHQVKHHRQSDMRKGRLRANSRDLTLTRKAVIGDVCHIIDSLCEHYQAFPVLEANLDNLNTGAREADRIYKAVSYRYTYSDTLAHKDARKNYWYGVTNWQHPYLRQRKKESVDGSNGPKAAAGPVVPLNLFPGSSIHPAGTSQACHCCGRNPLQSIKDAPASALRLTKYATLQLPDGEVLLAPTTGDVSDKLTIKERQALKAGQRISRDDARRLLKRYLRTAPKGTSSDTRQSVYRCAYTGCGNTMHADENAAINIGRKWWKAKIVQG
ncbi:type V CRISPR-associated protein Cas12c [Geopseudomonas aromaticivorans]